MFNLRGVNNRRCAGVLLWSCFACFAVVAMQPAEANELSTGGWVKAPENPVLALSKDAGAFDSHNLFAPAIVKHEGRYFLFYCGGPSGPRTNEPLINYQLGVATSDDSVHFKKLGKPLLPLGERDNLHVTPALVRDAKGNLSLDEDGVWHMVYCGNRANDVEHATSRDGLRWEKDPRSPIYRHAYSPSVLKVDGQYWMYYTHTSDNQHWEFHLATGPNLHSLKPHPENPILVRSQTWETGNLIYPYVLRDGKTWTMFYSGYWGDGSQTAIGTATSNDGIRWTKSQNNPVVTPTKGSSYDSVYTSSQSVIRDGDVYRMFYAGRIDKIHKYFAIGQATRPIEKK